MKSVVKLYIVTLFALWAVTELIGGFSINGDINSYLIIAGAFTLARIIVKPVLKIIFLPINILTFGLSGFLINVIILYSIAYFFPQVTITSWTFSEFNYQGFTLPETMFGILATYILSSLVLNLIVQFLRWL